MSMIQPTGPNLTSHNPNPSSISDEEAKILEEALTVDQIVNSNLRFNNQLGVEGAKALVEALRTRRYVWQ